MNKRKLLLTLSILGIFTICSCSKANNSSNQNSNDNPSGNQTTEPLIKTLSKRMPAEFEPVEMVKMCYPNNMPLSVYKTIAKDNKVLLLVNPKSNGASRISEARSALASEGANIDNITFLDMELDDDYYYWVRDFSPFYVFNNK